MDDEPMVLGTADEEIAAAKDYWSQLFHRFASDPGATLVHREDVLKGAADRARVLLTARGAPADRIDAVAEDFAVELSNAPVTSPGIDPHFEAIFNSLCDRVEAAISKVSKAPIRVARGIEPRVGVFASRLGVMATDASIITVGSQIFRFCNVVGKALARTANIDAAAWDTITDREFLRERLRSRPDVVRYWVDILISYSFTGTNIGVPVLGLPMQWMRLKDSIVDAMEIFVVTHEYAHHLQRHGRLLEASAGGARARARGEEFEADSIAIMIGQLVTGHQPGENLLMISGVGMVVMLSAVEMLSRARELLGLEQRWGASETHPPAEDRFDIIDRQTHLWGADAIGLRAQRTAYIRMMSVIADEVLLIVEALSRTEEFQVAAEQSRRFFEAHPAP